MQLKTMDRSFKADMYKEKHLMRQDWIQAKQKQKVAQALEIRAHEDYNF